MCTGNDQIKIYENSLSILAMSSVAGLTNCPGHFLDCRKKTIKKLIVIFNDHFRYIMVTVGRIFSNFCKNKVPNIWLFVTIKIKMCLRICGRSAQGIRAIIAMETAIVLRFTIKDVLLY